MKYRTKLYLAIYAITFACIITSIAFLLDHFFHHTVRDAATVATTIASITSVLIDPKELEQIRSIKDTNTPIYRKLQNQLRRVRDINKTKYVVASYVYVVRPSPTHPGAMFFVMASDIGPGDMGFFGHPLPPSNLDDLPTHLTDIFSEGEIYSDPWGTWVTGYAPIFNAKDMYIDTVGVDLSANQILAVRLQYILNISYIFFGMIGIAFIGSSFLVRRATKSLTSLSLAVEEIAKGNLDFVVSIETHDEFETLAQRINMMTQQLKERERLKEGFARYVSQYVLEKIMTTESPTRLEGERRKVTVLIADIRQFTHLSESLSPEQTVSILNEYFESMIEIIFKHQGMLDKFMGDGLMAEFGAPIEDPLQEQHAIEAAIEMHKELAHLNENWAQVNRPTLEMGIGIHTGYAIVGSIGSTKRMDYTAIGDTVNIAAELQQATKLYHYPILASATTTATLLGHFRTKDLGMISIPEREEKMHIFAIEH